MSFLIPYPFASLFCSCFLFSILAHGQKTQKHTHSHCVQCTHTSACDQTHFDTLYYCWHKKCSCYVEQEHSLVACHSFQVWQTWQWGQIATHTLWQKIIADIFISLAWESIFFPNFFSSQNASLYIQCCEYKMTSIVQFSILTGCRQCSTATQKAIWYIQVLFPYSIIILILRDLRHIYCGKCSSEGSAVPFPWHPKSVGHVLSRSISLIWKISKVHSHKHLHFYSIRPFLLLHLSWNLHKKSAWVFLFIWNRYCYI